MRDFIYKQGFTPAKLPRLKGHVKVSLHNCRTGKTEIQEGDNIVTNALRDLFALNYLGGIDYSKLLPLYQKFFGGILCYDTAHTLDADNYFPVAGHGLTAHAGDTAPATAAIINEDLSRGSPLHVDTGTDGQVTMTWEWGSEQGNGYIRALSLTHKDTGNAGLGNTSSAFQAFQPLEQIQGSQLASVSSNLEKAILTQYDDNHGLSYLIGGDGEYAQNPRGFETNKITVYIDRLAYSKAGLIDTLVPITTHQRKFTVTTTMKWYIQPAYWFDYANKRLYLFSNITGGYSSSFPYDNTVMKYAVIDCENESVYTEGTITSDTSNLARISSQSTGVQYMSLNFVNLTKEGNYIFLPTGSGNTITGYKKINMSNQGETQTPYPFTSSVSAARYGLAGGGVQIIGNRVLWGSSGYACTDSVPQPEENQRWSYAIHQANKIATLAARVQAIQGSYTPAATTPRYILANKMVNTTLFNLDSEIHKTTAKSLNVQYTLTEVSGE